MPVQSNGRKLIYGIDTVKSAAEYIKEKGSSNPLIVSTTGYSSTNFYRKLTEELENGYSEFREITYGPPLPEVEHLTEAYRNKECDSIISVGDASVIWSSKLLKYYYAHGAHHMAIPTTLTVSSFSDWAEYRIGDEINHVSEASLIPETVILDPQSSVETDASIWYSSGLSVMDYTFSNLMRDDISTEVEDLLLSSLERLIINLPGQSMESRMESFLSSWYSKEDGYSVSRDPMTPIRNSLKKSMDMPDELIAAVVLPLTAYYCMERKKKSLSDLANRLGFRGDNTSELSGKSYELVQGLIRKLGVTETLSEHGFGLEQMRHELNRLSLDKGIVDQVISSIYSPIS
ncbi:hypothetical protein IX51_09835 [uncultured archaeon]|nr:hypothetical protein IX51_09835 [uncultured archaeon]